MEAFFMDGITKKINLKNSSSWLAVYSSKQRESGHFMFSDI
jgi:hypothetical protein